MNAEQLATGLMLTCRALRAVVFGRACIRQREFTLPGVYGIDLPLYIIIQYTTPLSLSNRGVRRPRVFTPSSEEPQPLRGVPTSPFLSWPRMARVITAPRCLLQTLSDELLFGVLGHCAAPDALRHIASTCRRLRVVCHRFDEPLWKPLCLARFPRLHGVIDGAYTGVCFRELYSSELTAEQALSTEQALSLPSSHDVLDQFVVSMELHISANRLQGVRFHPEPTPSTVTPGLLARWTGSVHALGKQSFWTPETMPAWLQPDATCDTFSRVQLVVYLTWLHKAPRTLKIYHGQYTHGNDDGFGLHIESLGCGPVVCTRRGEGGEESAAEAREAAMSASIVEDDGHVRLEFGYVSLEDGEWLTLDGEGQQARFMAMNFPCLPWPPLPTRLAGGQVQLQQQQAPQTSGAGGGTTGTTTTTTTTTTT